MDFEPIFISSPLFLPVKVLGYNTSPGHWKEVLIDMVRRSMGLSGAGLQSMTRYGQCPLGMGIKGDAALQPHTKLDMKNI